MTTYKTISVPVYKKPISYTNKKKTATKKPKTARKKLVEEADRLFSLYIRQRYAINGIAMCVTCARRDHWKNMDCGHYIGRRHIGVRFDDMNAHAQCRMCNRLHSGNMTRYKSYMYATYGEKAMLELQKRSNDSISTPELQDIVEKYRKRVFTFQ